MEQVKWTEKISGTLKNLFNDFEEDSNDEMSYEITSRVGEIQRPSYVQDRMRNTRTEAKTMEYEKRPAVAVIKLSSLNDANLAAEALREGKTVICNYENIEDTMAQRASDFIRGAALVLGANFCAVNPKITVFVPSGVALESSEAVEEVESPLSSTREEYLTYDPSTLNRTMKTPYYDR